MLHIINNTTDAVAGEIPRYKLLSAKHIQDADAKAEIMDFTMDGMAEELAVRRRVVFPDDDGTFRETVIENIEEREQEVRVSTNASYLEDLGQAKPIPPGRQEQYTTKQWVAFALEGTGWAPGLIEYEGFRTISWTSHNSPYELLNVIANRFDMSLRFRIEVEHNEVVGRYVDMVKINHLYNGKEIVRGKDLKEFKRIINTENLATALWCLGPEPSEEGAERIETFLHDEKANDKWGTPGQYIWQVYEPTTEDETMTLARLTTLGLTELNKRKEPVIDYEITAVNLGHLYGHERVRLYDKVRIKDEEFDHYAEANVKRIERDMLVDSDRVFTFGDIIEFERQDLRAEFDKIVSALRERIRNTASNADQIRQDLEDNVFEFEPAITKDNNPPTNPETGDLWLETSTKTLYRWDGTDWVESSITHPGEIGAPTREEALYDDLTATYDSISIRHAELQNEALRLIDSEYLVDQTVKDALNASFDAVNGLFEDIEDGLGAMTPETATIGALINVQALIVDYRNAVHQLSVDMRSATEAIEARFDLLQSQYSDQKMQDALNKIATTFDLEVVDGELIGDVVLIETLNQTKQDLQAELQAFVISRGENLITNGTGLLGDNTNFSGWTYDSAEVFAGAGSFFTDAQSGAHLTDEMIPVSPDKPYRLETMAKSVLGVGHNYMGIVSYDVDGNEISGYMQFGAEFPIVELAQDLKPGDTTIHLTSTDGIDDDWGNGSHHHSLLFWGYRNAGGYEYPAGTYSRTALLSAWDDGAVDRVNNTITLNAPFSLSNPHDPDGFFRAGHKLSRTHMGSGYRYPVFANVKIPTEWTRFSGVIEGAGSAESEFPHGTAFVRLLFLVNRESSGGAPGDAHWINAIQMTDISGEKEAIEYTNGQIDFINGILDLKLDKTELDPIKDTIATHTTTINAQGDSISLLQQTTQAQGEDITQWSAQTTATAQELETVRGRVTTTENGLTQAEASILENAEAIMNSVKTVDYEIDYQGLVSRLDSAEAERLTMSNLIQDRVTTTTYNSGISSARQYAEGLAGSAETSAKAHADTVASSAETSAKAYTDGEIGTIDDRITENETLISQNGQQINLRAKTTELNQTAETLAQVISELIIDTTNGLVYTYNENGTITGYSVGPDGIQFNTPLFTINDGDVEIKDGMTRIKNAVIEDGHIKNMSFDKLSGGEMTLGGSGQNGTARLYDENDNPILILDSAQMASSELSVADIYVERLHNNEVVKFSDEDMELFVRGPSYGDDSNSGRDLYDAFATLQRAIDEIPLYYNGNCTIWMRGTATTEEDVNIAGFVGRGTIEISGSQTASDGSQEESDHVVTLPKSIAFDSNLIRFNIRKCRLERGDGSIVRVENSSVGLYSVEMNGGGGNTGLYVTRNAYCEWRTGEVTNVHRGIQSLYGSRVYYTGVQGHASQYGTVSYYASVIAGSGDGITGDTANQATQKGSITDGSWTYPSVSNPTPAPQPTEKTVTFKASSAGHYYHNSWGWNGTYLPKNPIQGKWGSYAMRDGAWFFGSTMRNTLNGKTIKKIRVSIGRASGEGMTGSRKFTLRMHQHSSKPSGAPTFTAGTYTGYLKMGERKWFDVTSAFKNYINTGGWYGFGVRTTSTSNYEYMAMMRSMTVEVTYEV